MNLTTPELKQLHKTAVANLKLFERETSTDMEIQRVEDEVMKIERELEKRDAI